VFTKAVFTNTIRLRHEARTKIIDMLIFFIRRKVL